MNLGLSLAASFVVHLSSRDPVILERREKDHWVPVCSSPCDVSLPTDAAYRVNGPFVVPLLRVTF